MPSEDADDSIADRPADLVAWLGAEQSSRLEALSAHERGGFVSSELASVRAALREVRERDLARGPVFCEWGSGLGAVCALAASLSYRAVGIEIEPALVDGARTLLADLGLQATFAHGSFLRPGDEDLVAGCDHTHACVTPDAYGALGLTLAECDVVFSYPWPGEEHMHDRLFLRHASPGALLVTFHDRDRVLVQRRTEDADELESLGWMDRPRRRAAGGSVRDGPDTPR